MAKPAFYITTPIYYPSGNLHIGHAYTTTLAWAIRNYKRLRGFDAAMLTGADEHGQKIAAKAEAAEMSPQAYVDMQNARFLELWQALAIDFDFYARTTSDQHMQAVQKQFSALLDAKIITKGEYVGWYSVSDEEFLTPAQAKRENDKLVHPVSGQELVRVAEPSYMFQMSRYAPWLTNYFATHPNFVYPSKVMHELTANFMDKGLEDLSVSRTSFTWGIPIREDPAHVIYVWLDALNNYTTTLGYLSDDDTLYQKYWVHAAERVHVVGKEIARFHAIYWPIILHATNQPLPTQIISHGWIVTPEGKMSKSKGNVIDPLVLSETYGAEALKYVLAAQIPVGNDGVFSEAILVTNYNADLVNNYGNLVSRVLALVAQNFTAPLQMHDAVLTPREAALREAVHREVAQYQAAFDQFQVSVALRAAMDLGATLNRYVNEVAPWSLTHDRAQLELVLAHLLNGIYAMSLMLSVITPQACTRVLNALGLPAFDLKLVADWHKFDSVLPQAITGIFPRAKT